MDLRHAVLAALALLPWSAGSAAAGPVLDHIRTQGRIRCGAVERPGLLETHGGQARGLLADLCRAIGVAVAGAAVAVDLHPYDSDRAFDAVRDGTDDVAFLSGAEIVDQHLAGRVLPGPAVYAVATAVLVPQAARTRDLRDLSNEPVCFAEGSDAQRTLEAWAARDHVDIVRMGYQEHDEMTDAYDAGACHAIVGEATALLALRRGRLLPTPLDRVPIIATTGLGDAPFSAVVGWSLATLVAADRPGADWQAGGAAALPLDDIDGLATHWQSAMIAATGTYSQILKRSFPDASGIALVRDRADVTAPTIAR